MPKKKTGQRKKAEKQKLRQKGIRNADRNIAEYPCECEIIKNEPKKKKFQEKFFILDKKLRKI